MKKSNSRRAVTLLELLTVMAIASVMIVLSTFSLNGYTAGLRISENVATIEQTLNDARQMAITENAVVEVRFYIQESEPNELVDIGVFRRTGASSFEIQRRLRRLHPGYPLNQDQSSILQNAEQRVSTSMADANRGYYGISYRADGSLDLPATSATGDNGWYLTLARRGAGETLPAIWSSIRLDPQTGRASIIRP
jgi:uncharacterized protein (TIGR02596 family)